jgi:NAD kinase
VPAKNDRKAVLVTRRTRLEELVARFHTLAQAKFYVEHLGADFAAYEAEHAAYVEAKRLVVAALETHGRWQGIDRTFLTNFLFGPDDVVLALGQDGLVANTMKYLDGHPLVGVNPDPYRYDGVLLPFEAKDVAALLPDVLRDRRDAKSITMARATLSDGQVLHAVNDLFIGPRSHVSARYEIAVGERRETQSSSGIIVSTGLGSTGWMRSVITGSLAVAGSMTRIDPGAAWKPQPWDSAELTFAVREPFPSRHSAATILFGRVSRKTPLDLVSWMPDNGVIFSDGIEADRLEFNSGVRATVDVADRVGRLVV